MTPEEIAFVQGAKWWEFRQSGGTMWQSDVSLASKEAEMRKENGTLGRTIDEIIEGNKP